MANIFAETAVFLAQTTAFAGMYETSLAQKAAMEQIDIKQQQSQLQLSQKKLSVYSSTEKLLKTQEAEMTTRGLGFGSPSFNAIQRESVNISSKELTNINTEKEFVDYNAKAERKNVRRSAHAKMFGQATEMGMSFAKLAM